MSDELELSLIDWLEERRLNCLRIAEIKQLSDREGWLEDAEYFKRAIAAIESAQEARYDEARWWRPRSRYTYAGIKNSETEQRFKEEQERIERLAIRDRLSSPKLGTEPKKEKI